MSVSSAAIAARFRYALALLDVPADHVWYSIKPTEPADGSLILRVRVSDADGWEYRMIWQVRPGITATTMCQIIATSIARAVPYFRDNGREWPDGLRVPVMPRG